MFVAEFKAELNRLSKQGGIHERPIQKGINKVNAAIKRCLNYIIQGDGDPGLVHALNVGVKKCTPLVRTKGSR